MNEISSEIRHNWTHSQIREIYDTPLIELIYRAATVHRNYHDPLKVQMSTLISIKTGGCSEDCHYCPQAARYHTNVEAHKLLPVEQVIEAAKKAKDGGSSRLCMGAAWRNVRDNKDFDTVLEMVRKVNELDMEVCCTLGMLSEEQAKRLQAAGLYAYNHNIDTSEEYYDDVITTRTYDDRLNTIGHVKKAGMVVCTGGIIGMGEAVDDRIGMLLTLSQMNPHPGSVPINALVPVEGTPLEHQQTASIWEMVRMVATARIVMPDSVIRLSAGRQQMSMEGQALCFLAGAGSLFAGDKLLTTPNPAFNEDLEMFKILGISPQEPFAKGQRPDIKPDPGKSFEERVHEKMSQSAS